MSTEAPTTLSLERYHPEAKAIVAAAQGLADDRRHAEVQALHLLARALERDPGVGQVLSQAGVSLREFGEGVEDALDGLPNSKEPAYLSPGLLDLLERAEREATRDRAERVGVAQLLNALSQEIRGPAGRLLQSAGVGPGSLRDHMAALDSVPRPVVRSARQATSPSSYLSDLIELARADRFDPVIGRDGELRRLLTILERRQKSHPLLVGEPGVGKGAIVSALAGRLARGDVPTSLAGARLYGLETGELAAGARLRGEIEERVRRLLEVLAADDRGEPILVVENLENLFGQGPSGSAVGELLAPVLARGELRILGTTTPEGLRKIQDRDASLLREFTLLPVEEPSAEGALEILRGVAHRYEEHHKVQITEGAIQAAVTLAKRYVQDRFLPDCAIDLLDEAASAQRVESDAVPREVDEAMARLESLDAQLATLEGATDALSVDVREKLASERELLLPRVKEMREEIESRRGAVAASRTLGRELDAARVDCARAQQAKDFASLGELEHVTIPDLERRLQRAEEAARRAGVGTTVLTEEGIAATLAVWTGIPVAKMLEEEAEKLLEMEQRLATRVVGQDDAVGAISRAVRRGRVGLRDPGKPIGSFLFLGPSGVGKTELAKAVAQFLFDDEAALTRLDMSEFVERHMAQRLIGAPPGYADSDQGGFLTEAVRQRPYSVLLFDEVEKAHADVFNLLLQVLDDGRLTDGRGRLADFSNTVVIMTSNIGSSRILETDTKLFESVEGRDALRDVLLDELASFFRPEFLNRVDEVVVFRPLDKVHLLSITEIQLRRLEGMLTDRQLTLRLSDGAKALLVDQGYEPALGARPLKRALLRLVQDPLAEAILTGKYAPGTIIHVDSDGDQLKFGS